MEGSPKDLIRSQRKRRPTVSNVASSASIDRNGRQSIIPSMSSSAHKDSATTGDSPHDKVGKLLKRYSTRLPSSGLGTARSKKKNDKEKYKNELSADNIPTVYESSYPSITTRPTGRPDKPAPLPQPSAGSVLPTKGSQNTTSADRSGPSTQAIPGLDEKKYPVPVRDFQDGKFDPQKYVQSYLADSADYQVRDYLDKLRKTEEQVSKDMQRNLFNSYSQFVLISSEISTIEKEIRSTRNMMNKLSLIVGAMRVGDNEDSGNDGTKEDTAELPMLRRQTTRRTDGSWVSTPTSIASSPALPSVPTMATTHHEILRSLSSASVNATNGQAKDVATRKQAQVEETLMDIDIMIAHRQIDSVIKKIESLKSSGSLDGIELELRERTDVIFDILSYDLQSEFTGRRRLIETISVLVRLGYEVEARDTFLRVRGQILQRRIEELRKDLEDVPFYISQLATVTFTLIRATIEIYRDCFPSFYMTSKLVDWTRRQVEGYASLFSLTMEGYSSHSEQFLRAVAATKRQAEQLVQIGMTMEFILRDVLEPQTPVVQSNANIIRTANMSSGRITSG